jgi:hypothetical protein
MRLSWSLVCHEQTVPICKHAEVYGLPTTATTKQLLSAGTTLHRSV